LTHRGIRVRIGDKRSRVRLELKGRPPWSGVSGHRRVTGREVEWQTYLKEAINKHRRKYSLRPMLERLR